jgi:DNA-binding transcriptional ArsR family regulator
VGGAKYKSEIFDLKEVFETFSNEHRLAILKLLKEKGEKSVGQIADYLELSFRITSKHLMYLAGKGVLARRYDGPFVLYKIPSSLSGSARTIIDKLL